MFINGQSAHSKSNGQLKIRLYKIWWLSDDITFFSVLIRQHQIDFFLNRVAANEKKLQPYPHFSCASARASAKNAGMDCNFMLAALFKNKTNTET